MCLQISRWPNIDTKETEGRSFCDVWWRCNHYNLPTAEENEDYTDASESNAVPLPNEDIIIYLSPHVPHVHIVRELLGCIHPTCLKYTKEHPFEQKQTIFLFCKGHSEEKVVDTIEKFVNTNDDTILDGLVDSQGIQIKESIMKVIGDTASKIKQSYLSAIDTVKESWQDEYLPDKVLEVECNPFPNNEDDEEITVYVDLISCEKVPVFKYEDEEVDQIS